MAVFTPIVIAATGILSGVYGIYLALRARRRIRAAKERYERAKDRYERAQTEYTRKGRQTQSAFADLGGTKIRAIQTLGKVAVFLRNARIRDRDDSGRLKIESVQLEQWESVSLKAGELLGGLASGTLTGVSTAAGVYGLVGALGSASTGTAISTLAGIAAKNATLAWLGGGAVASGGGGVAVGTYVLGGVVAGPAILIAGLWLDWRSAPKVETEVERAITEMNVAEEEMRTRGTVLTQVTRRATEVAGSIRKVEEKTKELLKAASEDEPEGSFRLYKVAKTLADLIDTDLIDKDGRAIL